jgi:tagatose-1,6-bisphosphate aldolase
LVRQVFQECRDENLPFFLEVLPYSLGKYKTKELLLEVLERIIGLDVHPDVFKIFYPGSPEKCKKVERLLNGIPWVLLSAGEVTFEEFKKELEISVCHGADGFLVGRALWQEFFETEDRQGFLKDVLPKRFQLLADTTC